MFIKNANKKKEPRESEKQVPRIQKKKKFCFNYMLPFN